MEHVCTDVAIKKNIIVFLILMTVLHVALGFAISIQQLAWLSKISLVLCLGCVCLKSCSKKEIVNIFHLILALK